MDPNGRDPDDLSIIDLFRAEVERHAATISDGLLALRKDPAAIDRMDGMIHASHAIKGGAQIVDLDEGIQVSRALEASFIAAQKGSFYLEREAIDVLLKGVDMLNQIARSAAEPEWLAQHEEEIGRLVAAMNGISSQEEAPEIQAPPPSTTEMARSPVDRAPTPPVAEMVSTPEQKPSGPQTFGIADPSMLELFRTEVQSYVAILNDGLLAFEKDSGAIDSLDPLMQAAHSIKGAARIVGFEVAATVSNAMEDCLAAARKGQVFLGPDQIHILLKGVDLLNQITEAADATGSESIDRSQDDIEGLIAAIQGILSAKAPVRTGISLPDAPSVDAAPVKRDATPGEGRIDMVDPTMLDLFQTEVETHVAVLNDGLLALESNPGATDQLEALMRAAHSIKGGARVLGLDVAVRVAHVMEDCFVAAQKGEVSLGPDQIDILLRIVDILTQLAHSLSGGETDWLSHHREEIDRLVGAISAIIHGETAIPVSPIETPYSSMTTPPAPHPPEPAPPRPQTDVGLPIPQKAGEEILPQQQAADKDRTVRVTAAKIERLMGQAGEVVVNARWLPAFSDALLELKRNHAELLTVLDGLQEVLVQDGGSSEASSLVLQARTKTKECSRKLAERLNQFDIFNSTSAALSDRLYHEVISVRMRPFSDGVQGFPRMVRDIARELGKKVWLDIRGNQRKWTGTSWRNWTLP